jgi:folate-binding Fe-S cluster repair protein YgfZ
MTDTDFYSVDPSRTVIAVEGEDRQAFLQGLIRTTRSGSRPASRFTARS